MTEFQKKNTTAKLPIPPETPMANDDMQMPRADGTVEPGSSYRVIDPNKFPKDSKTPVVVVVDRFYGESFGFRKIDIDGDGFQNKEGDKRELCHGEVISKLIESKIPEATVIGVHWPVDHLVVDNSEGVRLFEELGQLKKSGYRIDAINFSMSPPVPLDFGDISKITGLDVTQENIADQRALVALKLMTWSLPDNDKDNDFVKHQAKLAFRTMSAMTRVVQSGVPIYVGAGNDGPKLFNFYSLAHGVTSVAAVDARGIDSEYSARNSLASRKARGDFNVVPVTKNGVSLGVDFTGDGKVDLTVDKLSGKGVYIDPVIEKFNGQQVSAITISASDLRYAAKVFSDQAKELGLKQTSATDILSFCTRRDSPIAKDQRLRDKLLPVEPLLIAMGHKPEEAKEVAKQVGDYLHPDGLAFRNDGKGYIIFSYDGSMTPGTWFLNGTSLAAPSALCEDLRKIKK